MKVLLITGLLAKETVVRYAKETKVETEVLALKVPVAAFLTPQLISDALRKVSVENFDLILIPGLVRGDTTIISQTTGVPSFKGPQYAADLPTILDSIGEVKLSTFTPANELLSEKLEKKALEEIKKVEENKEDLLKTPGHILIGNLAIGKDFPMRVMGEIVDASLLKNEEIQRLAKHYVQTGADIIDVGMVVGESKPKDAKRIVAAAKAAVNVPVSIDSLDPQEIKAAVGAGADLVLSADAGNIKEIAPYISKVAVVLIPTNQKEGYFPKKPKERVQLLEEVMREAKNLGVTKILADLILDPLNILESFNAFQKFSARNLNVPIFVGISNVTELIDADSVGVNALLAKLSSEIGATVLLATEKSDKAKGTIREESTAAKMMFLAKKRASFPKDLGLNLLILKDKRNREEPYIKTLEKKTGVFIADQTTRLADLDKQGSFRILVDRENHEIVALHYTLVSGETPEIIVKGKNAEAVYQKIVELGLVSQVDHAAYLGTELAKAEIALKTGKEYIQDKIMFGD